MEDALLAKQLLENNPAALTASLNALLVKAHLHDEHKEAALRDQALSQAKADFQALARFPGHVKSLGGRLLYLDKTGDRQGRLNWIRTQAQEKDAANIFRLFHASELFQAGNSKLALEALGPAPRPGAEEVLHHILKALILADLPDGVPEAPACYEEAKRRCQR